jgi:hypothetical protein
VGRLIGISRPVRTAISPKKWRSEHKASEPYFDGSDNYQEVNEREARQGFMSIEIAVRRDQGMGALHPRRLYSR